MLPGSATRKTYHFPLAGQSETGAIIGWSVFAHH